MTDAPTQGEGLEVVGWFYENVSGEWVHSCRGDVDSNTPLVRLSDAQHWRDRALAAEGREAALREDADRFRALMRCGRIKMQGSSGVDPHTLGRNGNNVHFGAEFWPEAYDPEKWEATYGQSTRWGRAALMHLADAIIEEEARAALTPEPDHGSRTEGEG